MSCYRISVNEEPGFDPEAMGLVLASRSDLSMGQGQVMTLKGYRNGINTAPAFATNDKVVITHDGQPWFEGTAGPAEDTEGGIVQEIRDPWHALECSTLAVPPEEGLVGGDMDWTFSLQTYWSEMARRAAAADYQPVKTEVQFCAWPSGLDDFITARHAFGPVGRFAEIAQRILGYHPSAGTWWDYSTTPPTLRIGYRGSNVVTLDFNKIALRRLKLRDDLWPGFVQFLVTTNAVVDGGGLGGYSFLEIGEQFGVQSGRWPLTGKSSTGRGVATGTISIAEIPGAWIRTAEEDQLVFNWLRTPLWEGELSMPQSIADGAGIRPGTTVQISNGRAAWASMQAVVQEVATDLQAQRTTVRLGLHSIRDAATLYQFLFEALQVYRFNRAWNWPKPSV